MFKLFKSSEEKYWEQVVGMFDPLVTRAATGIVTASTEQIAALTKHNSIKGVHAMVMLYHFVIFGMYVIDRRACEHLNAEMRATFITMLTAKVHGLLADAKENPFQQSFDDFSSNYSKYAVMYAECYARSLSIVTILRSNIDSTLKRGGENLGEKDSEKLESEMQSFLKKLGPYLPDGGEFRKIGKNAEYLAPRFGVRLNSYE